MPATRSKPTVVENITILQVGKFGVRINESTWYGTNEPLTPTNFVPNQSYKVGLVVSKTGKKYISEIVGVADSDSAPAPTASIKQEAVQGLETRAQEMAKGIASPSPKVFDDKSIQIQRQGLYQAALQSPALAQWGVNLQEYLAMVREAADAGIAYVREGK